MNTTSSIAASSAYAVLSSAALSGPRSAYAHRVRTSAPKENWVAPIRIASAKSAGIGTRISAPNASASMEATCTVSATAPTRRCPNRSNSRA